MKRLGLSLEAEDEMDDRRDAPHEHSKKRSRATSDGDADERILASGRPRILFATPIAPAPTGNGLAMRAGVALDALAADAEVDLILLPVAGPVPEGAALEWLRKRSRRIEVLPLPSLENTAVAWLGDPASRKLLEGLAPLPRLARFAHPALLAPYLDTLEPRFDLVYVLRLYLAPLVTTCLGRQGRPRLVLDADDDDASTLASLAALEEARGNVDAARSLRDEGDAFARLASRCLPWFDSVLAASDLDARKLEERSGRAVEVLPNTVPIPPEGQREGPTAARDRPFRILFVGNLTYLPNRVAAERLARSILPRARERLGRDVELDLVGSKGPEIDRLGEEAGVNVLGTVPDVAPFYRAADCFVAPLAAGGGSRIKLLEAFSYRLPVVATSEAAAGLEVETGRHLLLAETDEEISEAIARLRDEELANRLARTAFDFVTRFHDRADIAAALPRMVDPRHETKEART